MATVQCQSWVQTLELPQPSLQDNTADAERLLGVLRRRLGVERVDIDLATAAALPALLRDNTYRVRGVVIGAGDPISVVP